MEGSKIKVPPRDVRTILDGQCLFDDVFMQVFFEDSPQVVETVLRVVLGMPALRVETLKTQEKVAGVGIRTVCFDVLCQDADGTWYNVEIQRDSRGASPRRARYYSSALDVHLSEAGEKFDELPNTVVVFITATDVLGLGYPVYNINRTISGVGRMFDDGSRIVYVNGSWRGDDDIGRLMEDFAQRDSDKMHYKALAARAQGIKKPEVVNKKEDNMSEEAATVLKKYCVAWREEGVEEGMKKGLSQGETRKARSTARAMLADNMDVRLIARYTSLPIEEIEHLKASQTT